MRLVRLKCCRARKHLIRGAAAHQHSRSGKDSVDLSISPLGPAHLAGGAGLEDLAHAERAAGGGTRVDLVGDAAELLVQARLAEVVAWAQREEGGMQMGGPQLQAAREAARLEPGWQLHGPARCGHAHRRAWTRAG